MDKRYDERGSKIRTKFMSEQIIKLTDTAANRIKEIMANADNKTVGVRVGVKSGGCAGMSYSMEYAKDKKTNDEVIEDKGVKVFIDPAAIIYLLGTEMDYKKEKFSSQFVFKNKIKAVEAGAHGTLEYTIKEGANKDKIADQKILKKTD